VFVYDRQMVAPVQPIAELLGATMSEDLGSGEISVTYRGATFRCRPGSTSARQNMRDITLPLAAYCRGDVLYVPLASLAEALGGNVREEATTHQIMLTLPGAPPLAMPRREATGVPGVALEKSTALYVANLDGSDCHRLTYDGEMASLPTISHDGKTLLWESLDSGKLFLRPLNSPRVETLGISRPEHNVHYHNPYFSRDDRRILFACSQTSPGGQLLQQICSMAVDGSRERTLADTGANVHIITEGANLTVSPDGLRMVYKQYPSDDQDEHLMLATIDGQAPVSLGVNPPSPIFSPDGRRLAWISEWQEDNQFMNAVIVATITNQGINTRQLVQQTNFQCEIHPGCFTSDSRKLVCRDHGLAIYELATGKRTAVLDNAEIDLPSFTPDGAHLVFICQGHLCACRLDGSDIRFLTPSMPLENGAIWGYTYAPGDRIIFAASPE
jgi:Tol biopolymer transport system component